MSLLFSLEAFNAIEAELSNVKNEILVVSAFCKENILYRLQEKINREVPRKRLLVRFTLLDIINGATDISIYDFCKTYGWEMYVLFNLHAKTYVFDRKRCLIGSANATNKGLGIGCDANIEISKLVDIDSDDLKKIEMLFDSAIKMDDLLYARMRKEYLAVKTNSEISSNNWSDSILFLINEKKSYQFFMHEFPQDAFCENIALNNLDFLEVKSLSESSEIKDAFLRSKAFRWLYHELNATANKQIFFGELTQKLHNRIIKDPPPYRKDVKILLANLLSWVNVFAKDFIEIERPNYSQIIKIKK